MFQPEDLSLGAKFGSFTVPSFLKRALFPWNQITLVRFSDPRICFSKILKTAVHRCFQLIILWTSVATNIFSESWKWVEVRRSFKELYHVRSFGKLFDRKETCVGTCAIMPKKKTFSHYLQITSQLPDWINMSELFM